MKRNVGLDEISDGKLYSANDMVKAGCGDCVGCHACCCGMGDSILLDPYDVYRLTTQLGKRFEELLTESVELGVVDGLVLPHLKMTGPQERCFYLNEEGRCAIHPHRPGICRLFPLGRYYENGSFQYFLQTGECKKQKRTKVKVGKWIDTPDLTENERFVTTWHYFLKDLEETLKQGDDALAKNLNLYLLNRFYLTSYDAERPFYRQFADRMRRVEGELGLG